MLITVTTTSKNLLEILTPTQKASMDKTKFSTSREVWYYSVLIQNLGNTEIYLDFWTPALVTEWIQIWVWEIFTFTGVLLEQCFLIAPTANNNIRITSN